MAETYLNKDGLDKLAECVNTKLNTKVNTSDTTVVRTNTDQTVSGIKTFSNYIKTPQVANASGKALVRYKDTEVKSVFGNDSSASVLMGNTDRPYYSKSGSDFDGTELALKSDVTSETTARTTADSNLQTQINAKQSSLSTTQMNAVNSGITSSLVSQISTNKTNIATNTTNIAKKLETSNIKAGSNITISTSGNNVTINAETGEGGTNVYVNSVKQDSVSFSSDPQTQITNKMDKTNPTGTGSFSLNRKSGTTIGVKSVAEGYDTTASGNYSHAEGYYTVAAMNSSHAEGRGATASGNYSHAEGYYTTASGEASHAEGWGTTASGGNQHVFGKYNISDTSSTYVEIVGNGETSAKSNARTLDWSGNETLAGNLKASGLTDGTTTATMSNIVSLPKRFENGTQSNTRITSQNGSSTYQADRLTFVCWYFDNDIGGVSDASGLRIDLSTDGSTWVQVSRNTSVNAYPKFGNVCAVVPPNYYYRITWWNTKQSTNNLYFYKLLLEGNAY